MLEAFCALVLQSESGATKVLSVAQLDLHVLCIREVLCSFLL